jgi:hypothetical protein
MPLEGHWERQQTPLRLMTARERRIGAIVASALAVATVALVLYIVLADSGSSAPAPGCISVTAASTMGGATVHACGDAAQRWCTVAAGETTPLARAIRPQCARIAESPAVR